MCLLWNLSADLWMEIAAGQAHPEDHVGNGNKTPDCHQLWKQSVVMEEHCRFMDTNLTKRSLFIT
jgi:hypothetical protein